MCDVRIKGDYPIFIPRSSLIAEKLVEKAHCETLHGGVGLTTTKIKLQFWIPKLQQMIKTIIHRCYGCKKFGLTSFGRPTTGELPEDKTEVYRPFQVAGVDFAGLVSYKVKEKREGKAYIKLFCDSLSRGVYLEILKDQTLVEFLKSLKRLIAKWGFPENVYSDNDSTYVVAAKKWLRKVLKDERLHDCLNFNFVAFWCLQSTMVGWSIWRDSLNSEEIVTLQDSWQKKSHMEGIGEVLLDVAIVLNNISLSYV